MLLAWKTDEECPCMPATFFSYAPTHTRSARRDIEIIKKEIPLDVLEVFFFLTPYQFEDHKVLFNDMPARSPTSTNTISNTRSPTRQHDQGSEKLLSRDAWTICETQERIQTILRRARTFGVDILRLAQIILWFARSLSDRRVHPLQGRGVRLRNRHEQQPELPVQQG